MHAVRPHASADANGCKFTPGCACEGLPRWRYKRTEVGRRFPRKPTSGGLASGLLSTRFWKYGKPMLNTDRVKPAQPRSGLRSPRSACSSQLARAMAFCRMFDAIARRSTERSARYPKAVALGLEHLSCGGRTADSSISFTAQLLTARLQSGSIPRGVMPALFVTD